MKLSLLEFAIVCSGLQYILGASRLTKSFREASPRFGKFLACPKCLGFHLGWLLSWNGPWASWPTAWQIAMSGLAGLVLTAVGRSLMDLVSSVD